MRISDWSSDVCSSDLRRSAGWRNIDRAFTLPHLPLRPRHLVGVEPTPEPAPQDPMQTEPLRGIVEDAWEARDSISPKTEGAVRAAVRSEERRVGKECVSRI